MGAYILLQVFLPMLESGLTELAGYLRGRIVHEVAVLPKYIVRGTGTSAGGLLLVGAGAVAVLVRLLLRDGRRRRPELRDRRDVLRDWVVEGRRLPVCRSLHLLVLGRDVCCWFAEKLVMPKDGNVVFATDTFHRNQLVTDPHSCLKAALCCELPD
jgi:hypothetical protein